MEDIILQICGVLITAIIGWAATRFSAATGVNIDAHHRDALHQAIVSGVAAAMDEGLVAGADETYNRVLSHARRSVPDAIAHFGASEDVLRTIATRYTGE